MHEQRKHRNGQPFRAGIRLRQHDRIQAKEEALVGLAVPYRWGVLK